MNHFGEIEYLTEMVKPDIAVISNIGDAHIQNLGSREGILKAKCEIFSHLKKDGLAVLNGDDALLDTVAVPFRTVRCGKSERCQARITEIADHGVEGISCAVVTEKDRYALTIPAPGEHMAYAAAIAAAVGEALGLSREEIARGRPPTSPRGAGCGSSAWRTGGCSWTTATTPTPAAAAALEILARTECDKRVAVLGDMGELGDIRSRAHFNMGALASMLGVDLVFAIGSGDLAGKIADGVALSGGSVLYFPTKEEALPELQRQLGTPGTVMLVKASHAMKFGWLVDRLLET